MRGDKDLTYKIILHQYCRFQGQFPFHLKIGTYIAQLFLDLADRLKVSSAIERIASMKKEFDEMASNVSSGNVQPPD